MDIPEPGLRRTLDASGIDHSTSLPRNRMRLAVHAWQATVQPPLPATPLELRAPPDHPRAIPHPDHVPRRAPPRRAAGPLSGGRAAVQAAVELTSPTRLLRRRIVTATQLLARRIVSPMHC